MRKKISVVIPLYNHEKYIIQALRSLKAQSLMPSEVIIIDDGSEDGSYQQCQRFLKEFKLQNKWHLISQSNQGAAATLNQGISMAKNDWIAILNSDDVYHPDRLLILSELRRKRFAFTGVNFIYSSKAMERNLRFQREWYEKQISLGSRNLRRLILQGNLAVSTSNFFFAKSLFQEVGGFRNLRLFHDYDFLLRASAISLPQLISKKLLDYRVHPSNTVSSFNICDLLEERQLANAWLFTELLSSCAASKRTLLKRKREIAQKSNEGLLNSLLLDVMNPVDELS